MRFTAIAALVIGLSSNLQAGILTFLSTAPANNATTRASWLAAIGISSPEFLVDFESGFTDGQNIGGQSGLFPAGLVIDNSGTGIVQIETSSGGIGGSNPIGTAAVRHNESAYLELDFSANPVGYVGFYSIDHGATNVIVTFEGGGTESFSLDATGVSGNTAEFGGIFRNDQPRITLVQFDATGDGNWGLDNIEYGDTAPVPEPSSCVLLTLAGALFGGYRFHRRGRMPEASAAA